MSTLSLPASQTFLCDCKPPNRHDILLILMHAVFQKNKRHFGTETVVNIVKHVTIANSFFVRNSIFDILSLKKSYCKLSSIEM